MRWWGVAAAVLMLLSSQTTPGRADDSAPSSLARRLDEAIASFHAKAGVVVADPRHTDRYAHEAERVFPSASLYKLGVMVEAYRRVADGSLSLGARFTVLDEDDEKSYTAVGETLTLAEAIERMITVSDNTTAHLLVRILDAHRINATVAALGLTDTRINTALRDEERTAPFNTTSARDMERLLVRLVNGTVLGRVFSGAMLATLGRQRVNDRIPTGVPPGTFVAHKTGNLDRIAHDAGVIMTPAGPRVVVVLTSDYARYDDVIELTHRVAELAFDGGLAGIAARVHPEAPPSATPADVTAPVTGATATETTAVTEPTDGTPEPSASTLASGSLKPTSLAGQRLSSTTSGEEPPLSSTTPAEEPAPSSVLFPPLSAWTYTGKSPDVAAWPKAPWLLVEPEPPLLRAATLPSAPVVRGPSPLLTTPRAGSTSPAAAGPVPILPVGPVSGASAPSTATAPSVAIAPLSGNAPTAKPLPAPNPDVPYGAAAPALVSPSARTAPADPHGSPASNRISPAAPSHQIAEKAHLAPTPAQREGAGSHGTAAKVSSVNR